MPSSAPRARYDDYDDDDDEDGFDAVDDDDEDGDFYDDGEDDDEDEEELEAWERAAAAEEVVYDEEELEELKAAEAEREADALFDYETREAGGEDELRFASEEDRELAENRRRLAKRGIRVMGCAPRPTPPRTAPGRPQIRRRIGYAVGAVLIPAGSLRTPLLGG